MATWLILFISAVIDLTVVFIASRISSKWLYSTVVINLLLVSIFGGKLVDFFGFTTNAGNIFYACVFFAAQLIMGQKREEDNPTELIWFGVCFVIMFIVLSQLAISFMSVPGNTDIAHNLWSVFSLVPRITIASLIAYIFALYINIRVYLRIRKSTGYKYLWLRANVATIVSQFVDSVFFFTLAFLDLSASGLMQAILAGWIIKTAVGILGTGYLYLQQYLDTKQK